MLMKKQVGDTANSFTFAADLASRKLEPHMYQFIWKLKSYLNFKIL